MRATLPPPTSAIENREPSAPVLAVVAADGEQCAHCGAKLPITADRRGLRRRFCCHAHREAARLRRERGLPEDYPVQSNRHGRRRLGGDGDLVVAERYREAS